MTQICEPSEIHALTGWAAVYVLFFAEDSTPGRLKCNQNSSLPCAWLNSGWSIGWIQLHIPRIFQFFCLKPTTPLPLGQLDQQEKREYSLYLQDCSRCCSIYWERPPKWNLNRKIGSWPTHDYIREDSRAWFSSRVKMRCSRAVVVVTDCNLRGRV